MSNSFNGDNWFIDTAMAASIFDDGVFIRSCKWYPHAADNDLLITNADGDTIVMSRAKVPTGATQDEIGAIDFEEARGFHRGFRVNTIDDGSLYVQIN